MGRGNERRDMADKCYTCGMTWADWQESLLSATEDDPFGARCVDPEDGDEGEEHDWED